MPLAFPNPAPYRDNHHMVVWFNGIDPENKEIKCKISVEALNDFCNGNFLENQEFIQLVASSKFDAGQSEPFVIDADFY